MLMVVLGCLNEVVQVMNVDYLVFVYVEIGLKIGEFDVFVIFVCFGLFYKLMLMEFYRIIMMSFGGMMVCIDKLEKVGLVE